LRVWWKKGKKVQPLLSEGGEKRGKPRYSVEKKKKKKKGLEETRGDCMIEIRKKKGRKGGSR